MSLEERKIREELEREVENDLEREIKEGMHGLALKLHNLQLHRTQTTETKQSSKLRNKQRKTIVSEVNINIKMEGGATIHIKETKKLQDRPIPNPNPNPKQARRVKFDWTQTLRSTSDDSSIRSKIEGKKVASKIALLEVGWKY